VDLERRPLLEAGPGVLQGLKRARRLAAWLLSLALAGPAGAQSCPEPARCIADYLALPSRVALIDPPLSGEEVDGLVEALDEARLRAGPLVPGELEKALGFGPLRAALGVPLAQVDTTDIAGGRALVFHDPLVGRLEGILLLPDGPGPFPAVLALHGHGDRAEVFVDRHHGRDYPVRGIALLAITLRGMNIDEHEHLAARELMRHGLQLIGVRAYEALRALAYLRSLPEIDARRTGLIGHSGGSSLGNLLVRLEPDLAAYVSDHAVDFRSSGWREPYHCETVPGLYPIHRQLNDLSRAGLPVLQVRYGYGRRKLFGLDRRESRRILDFFAGQLGPLSAR
jgi:hypothetical protein